MAEFMLTVDGVEREVALASLQVDHVVNGYDILTADINDELGLYQPPLDGVVVLTRTDVSPGETYFEGLIQSASERSMTGIGVPRTTQITAYDYGCFATFREVTELTFGSGSPADTLSSALATLVSDFLTDYGVTLHGSQASGPTLDPVGFDGVTVEAVLNELSQRTGWVWKIDAQKRLRMWDPTTEAASFNVTATNGKYVEDIKVDRFRQRYANRVIVYGGTGYNQNISGETKTGDGVTTKFYLDAPMYYFETGGVGFNLVVTRSGPTVTIEEANLAGSLEWQYDPSDYSITQVSGAVLGAGETVQIGTDGYSAWYPMRVVSDGRGSPPAPARDLIIRRPDLFGRAAMQTLADAALAASQTDLARTFYPTDDVDLRPGQTQTITLSERNLSGSFTCMTATLAYVQNGGTSAFRLSVTSMNTAGATAIWMDLYRRWLGGGSVLATSSSAASSGSTPTTTSVTSPTATIAAPVNPGGSNGQLQFNSLGRFGGAPHILNNNASGNEALEVGSNGNNRISWTTYALAAYLQEVLGAKLSVSGLTPANESVAVRYFEPDSSEFGSTKPVNTVSALYRGLTPDTDQAFPTPTTGVDHGGGINGAYHDVALILKNNTGGTGAIPGGWIIAEPNPAGNGAASGFVFIERDGTRRYVWVEAGTLRIHTSAPTEDNTTVSHTAGTVVGAQT